MEQASAGSMACPNCGSWAIKADRSPSGRMVCGRCGEPLGIGARRRLGSGRGAGQHWRLWLGLTALVAVSAVLAGLQERSLSPLERHRFRQTTETSLGATREQGRALDVAIC